MYTETSSDKILIIKAYPGLYKRKKNRIGKALPKRRTKTSINMNRNSSCEIFVIAESCFFY